MSEEKSATGLSLDSITVDEKGRVIVTDPKIAEQLKAAEAAFIFRRRGNEICNTVKGCGTGQNIKCQIK